MTLLWIVAGVSVLAASWSLFFRDFLERQTWPWSQAFFNWLKPIEIRFWRNSKTIFMARLKMIVGALLSLFTQIGTISLEPLVMVFPPERQAFVRILLGLIPLILTVLGVIDEYLRRETTKPIELVAVDASKLPPDTKQALDIAEMAKAEAVAAVVTAQSEGTVQK
jgi:hypothetical protein